ncbi:MAG: HEAT repeat domain-containing protein [Acidobacteria bacterium]|nr:HEAT repeat domain-containing protein [Acidobacteriota bacterium]
MPGKKAFNQKLAELSALSSRPPSEAGPELRRALRDRSNYVVAKAATISGELGLKDLIPDLTAAFERFFEKAEKTDPQCWAKNAIAKTLKDFEHEDPELYLRGMKHFQPEPVWGGARDTAATLRATCAFALIGCRSVSDLDILRNLVDLLADPEPPVRGDAARAVAQLNRREGALLLRLKIHNGDESPEVMGACFSALLELSPAEGIELAARHLDGGGEDVRYEAAAALGESKEPEAFEALKACWQRTPDPRFRKALLISMGASRQPAAIAFLLALIAPDSLTNAADAIAALAPNRFREDVRAQVEGVVRSAGSERLVEVFRKEFKD